MPVRSQFETEAEWLDHMRLWFAGQALPTAVDYFNVHDGIDEAAEWCYKIADAMLEAREG